MHLFIFHYLHDCNPSLTLFSPQPAINLTAGSVKGDARIREFGLLYYSVSFIFVYTVPSYCNMICILFYISSLFLLFSRKIFSLRDEDNEIIGLC